MTRRKIAPRRPSMQKSSTYHSDWMESLNHYAGAIIFYALLLLMAVFSWISLPVSGVAPFWLIIIVYIWSVRWPDLMPAFLMFGMGILSDIVIGTPLGVHALAILAIGLLARLQQRFLATQSFIAVWANFALLALLFSFIVTGLSILAARDYSGVMSSFGSSMVSWGLLAIVFPVFSVLSHVFMKFITKLDP